MASGGHNNGDDQPGVIGNTGGTVSDFTDKEAALKLEKSRAKSSLHGSKTSCCFWWKAKTSERVARYTRHATN